MMLRRTILSVFAVVGLMSFLSVLQTAQAETPKIKILFLTESKGFKHGSVNRKEGMLSPSEVAMTQLGQQTGLFTIHCTQDTKADFTKENLKNYDIVMFYTTGELPISDADRDYFMNDWLKQKGHGWIGFHSAADTYSGDNPTHQWYWDLCGGSFNGHPWGSGELVTVSVHDTAFPAMKPFGNEFQIKDEIYWYKHWNPENVHVLMSLNLEKCKTKGGKKKVKEGDKEVEVPDIRHVPVAWCRSWGDGKIFFNNLGHNESTWTDKRFLDSTETAIRWILNQNEGDTKPNPDVSKAWQEKSVRDGAGK